MSQDEQQHILDKIESTSRKISLHENLYEQTMDIEERERERERSMEEARKKKAEQMNEKSNAEVSAGGDDADLSLLGAMVNSPNNNDRAAFFVKIFIEGKTHNTPYT